MAIKSPLSTYADTFEDERIVQEYKDQQKVLMDSLVNRKQLFDPTLLAMAQGFLSPTKTGSFGESLGNVAAAVAPVQQAEEKRSQDIAKMRFDMAQQNYMMNRKDQAARMLAPPKLDATAPAAGAPSADGAPVSPIAGAVPSVVPKPAALSRFAHITPELVLQIGLKDPDLAAVATKYLEDVRANKRLAMDAVKVTERGTTVVNPDQPGGGTFTPAPGRPTVPRFLPGIGPIDLTELDADKFDKVRDVLSLTPDDLTAQKELSRLVGKYRGAPTVAGAGPLSPADAELDKKRRELILKSDLESDALRKKDFIDKSLLATTRIPSLSSLEQFALSPNAAKLLGVFEGSSLGQALAKMVEPTMPQIREAFTQYGLPEGVKADQGFALQQIALINAEMRKILRAPGEGAQSDMENRAALAAGLDRTDTPGALLKKVRFLKAQAEFQRDVGRELNKSKLGPTDFLLSDNYDNLIQRYEQKLTKVLGLTLEQTKPPASNPSANNSKARDKLKQELGIK